MSNTVRVGLVGLDTSHVVRFSELLNHPEAPLHVPGGRIVAAFPGGKADFELSISRVQGFTDELRQKHGVRIVDSPEAVAEAADLVFIESVHGSTHLEEFRRTLPFRRPTFIDKPIALNLADTLEIFRLAQEAGVPVMSCSALRYADNFAAALRKHQGAIESCDVFGPMGEMPTMPGVFWYGIHSFEMIVTAMGVGCREVAAVSNDAFDTFILRWSEGRQGVVRGLRRGHQSFGAVVHGQKEFELVNVAAAPRPYYVGLLEAIMSSLPQGRSAVPEAQTIEIVRLMEAANQSRATGRPVALAEG